MNKLREIVEMPWVLLSCGFWMVLAFIRGQQIRYQQWRMRRLEAQRAMQQNILRELDRRISGDK
jgi:hypothetical protein